MPSPAPDIDALEPEIERLLGRFRIPADDAQQLLDEILLTLLTKRERIRDPQRWLLRTMRTRCLLYWRDRRRRLYRVVDSGLLTLLTSGEVPEEEKEALRGELRRLLPGLEGSCRDILGRRYGLGEGQTRVDPRPWRAEEASVEKVLGCLEALARRFARGEPSVGETPPGTAEDEDPGQDASET